MASTSSPYGFQPISHESGTPRTLRIPNGIHSGLASNIYKYQPVKIDTTYGTITPITGTTDPIFGIFAGVEYTPTGGRPAVSPFWPASTTYDSSNDMNVYIWAAWDPTLRLRVQADGTVAQTLLGSQFNVANPGNGSTVTGLSAAGVLHAGVAGASQGQFALQEFYTDVNDAIGDAYTDLIVLIANPQIGPAPQASIG